jgi:hypothetical protein
MSKKTYVSYYEKLKSPLWQKMRLEIMERDGFACLECGDKGTTLNVHHTYYERGRDPWDYPPESLRTLCEPHHEEIEGLRKEILGRMHTIKGHRRILAFIDAMTTEGTMADFMDSVGGYTELWREVSATGKDKAKAELDLSAATGSLLYRATTTIQTALAMVGIRAGRPRNLRNLRTMP